MRSFFILAAAWIWLMPIPQTQAQSTTQQITDVVFSEIEKRVLRDVLGNGRYETAGDGGYQKASTDGHYDDLKKGDDGRHYGKKEKNKHKGKNKGRGKGLPPGLAKRDQLPPGLQKQLERNGRLPPGLAKNPLPYEAVINLPPPPQGTERVVVDTSVVLLEKGTDLILDVLTDVLTKR